MNRRSFLVSTLSAALLHAPVWAAEAPAAPVEAPVEGVKVVRYDGPRIGDIAPEFAFPGPDRKLWSLREQRGKAPVLLVLTGEVPNLASEKTTPVVAMAAIASAAVELKKAGVTTVLISRTLGIDIGALKDLRLLALSDANGAMARLFNVSQTSVTIVAIDRGGFLRRVETVRDVADVAPLLLKIADPTPQVEIGQPAPDFSMPDMNGHIRRLSDLRGQKNLLLTFFPKCFTGG